MHVGLAGTLDVAKNGVDVAGAGELRVLIVLDVAHVGVPGHREINGIVIGNIWVASVGLPASVWHVVGLDADSGFTASFLAGNAHEGVVGAGVTWGVR